MDHDVGGIEYVMPIGDMLYVDKVDYAAIHEPVHYIAGATPDYESETDIFIAFNSRAQPQVCAHGDQQADANDCEQSAHSLEHAKHAAVIADMREMNQAIPCDSCVLFNRAIDPISDQL